MLQALHSFISDIFNSLTPEVALAGGIPMPPRREEKPSLSLHKGGNVIGNILGGGIPAIGNAVNGALGLNRKPSQGNNPSPAVPKPPQTTLATPPVPPAPPAPPTSADTAGAMNEGYANSMRGFGYKASLLRGSKDPATNTATGTGSLLGN